jgi:hypothetical protein
MKNGCTFPMVLGKSRDDSRFGVNHDAEVRHLTFRSWRIATILASGGLLCYLFLPLRGDLSRFEPC